jgi:hypothetical protein
MGDLVDLPGDGDRLSFGSNDHHQARGLVEAEVARTKGINRLGGRWTARVSHVVMVAYFVGWSAKRVRKTDEWECIGSSLEFSEV